MKNEVRVAANEAVVSALREALGNRIVPVTVAKKDGYAFDTGVKDENGKTVYAVIEATVKNTEDTKTSQAFDLEAAVQARIDKENAPKKEPKKKEADPEAEAKRAKYEAQKQAVAAWCMENLTGEGMTTTDILNAMPDMVEDGVTPLKMGGWLTAIAKENPLIQRDVVKGKPYYSRA